MNTEDGLQPKSIDLQRRAALKQLTVGAACVASGSNMRVAMALDAASLGSSTLHVISDGQLSLPASFVFPNSINPDELSTLLQNHNLDPQTLSPDCNISVWQNEDRLILFDVGAGPNFMPTAGKLLDNLSTAGIDPYEVTDVVFTHAHPDHLWGLLDDFDELICPDANYHMAATEWDYWRHPDTLDNTPEERKAFVVGAQNRFPLIEEKINLFKAGQEVIPGVEAVDTSGHTPGHSAFALHSGGESIMLIGDALTNIAVSFARPDWPTGSDQDPEKGIATRIKLLDRLAHEQIPIVGYHLPHPGKGRVQREGNHYRFVI